MSDCPRCASLTEVIQTVSASESELRSQVTALNRSLALAEKREQAAKDKLDKQHEAAGDTQVIYQCLDVWVEHCWAGKAKPKSGPTGPRIARIRKALGWGFDAGDICDAFRGLGLLPYRNKYNVRSSTLKPGFYRASDVKEALCEEARLEKFRDHYRRLSADPVDVLRERAREAQLDAHNLVALVARRDRLARYERMRVWPDASAVPPWMTDAMFRVLFRLLGTRIMDSELQGVALTCALAAEHAQYDHEYADFHPDVPRAAEVDGQRLFVIEGGKAA